ncbi:hypothetical protein HZB69_02440 [Candidatus Amesbacteria bacterium]|nr:hypothetical protein [Candidatus Amesbacteria bacterium]
MQTATRINITLSPHILAQMNAILPFGQRSSFIEKAVGEKLKKIHHKKKMTYAEALNMFTTKLKVKSRPGWENIENIVTWVNEGRTAANRDYSYIPYAKTKDK